MFHFKVSLAAIAFLLTLALSGTLHAEADEKPINRLGWLVGQWTFEDVQVNGEYREAGTRDCHFTLDGDYIQCISNGTSHTGNQRTYYFFFNYNHLDKRFEATSVVGGFPRKILYTINVSPGNQRLDLVYGGWEKDGINFESHAIIRYNGSDQYIWESHLAHEGPETDEYEVRFRDTVTRRN